MDRLARFLAAASLLGAVPSTGSAQVGAWMFRYPDVSATQIVFVYAGDLWIVPKAGGTAARLTTAPGEEEFPRFSPDGSKIAFSANYDGNTDIYVMPAAGGEVTRITHHPMADRMLDWYPDGRSILFASGMESGVLRENQLFEVPATGGLPRRLPVPIGEYGAVSPDGRTLAYQPRHVDYWSNWKRYRGGWAPDIWLFDLRDTTAKNLTDSPASEAQPMWHGSTLYFLSDRGPEQRQNIWAYPRDGSMRQVTRFDDYDITFPAIGPSEIVFQKGGHLYLLDLATEKTREVKVDVTTDLATLKPRIENVARLIQHASISPNGKRVVFEARGELFTVPAEEGVVRNLTTSSGTAERYPSWSPDGKWIGYWTDRSGEYELTVRPADGGAERKVTSLGAGFRYPIRWAPDGKRAAFLDQDRTIYVVDLETGKTTRVDQEPWPIDRSRFKLSWSADSRWLAYARGLDARNYAIFVYDAQSAERHQVTSGYFSDTDPSFDPDGKYLFFLSQRTLNAAYSDVDDTWIYPNTTNVVLVTLRKDIPSPLAPRNDTETASPADTGQTRGARTSGPPPPPPVTIDFADMERRLVVLPPRAGNYEDLNAVRGKVVYRRSPRTGSGDSANAILVYDLKERKEQTILEDADEIQVAAGGEKLLARNGRTFAVVDIKPAQKFGAGLKTAQLEAEVNPRAEWRQMFADAWRFERDFFYDPTLHGVDWRAMRAKYAPLVDQAVTRWDLHFILGELVGELNSGHLYRSGGDTEEERRKGIGLLGVDWELANGAYRIKRIVDGGPWDSEVRSPFRQPGVEVKEGDYVLAVNGAPLDPAKDPWASFEGLADQTVSLSVSSRPTLEGAREVLVRTFPARYTAIFLRPTQLSSEVRLRHLAWIEQNRARVAEASGGRIGYIYVPSTGVDGQTELIRQFRSQFTKDGLIIDDRFNAGGQIPDRFIEVLNRPPLSFWALRAGIDWQWPPNANFGPKAMLINGWAGSGGDAFPYFFKKAGLGPLIGQRTWGGLIGPGGGPPPLVDGGTVTAGIYRMYSTEGVWYPEGHGTDPDIAVMEDPAQMARGKDVQLERAIAEVMRKLDGAAKIRPRRPPYEDRSSTAPGKTNGGNNRQ